MPTLREPVYYSVPARTRPVPCKSCGVDMYYVLTSTGGRMPVDCTGETDLVPTDVSEGVGIAHFARCPEAAKYRRSR
jgi:hypothetical protein